MSLKLSDTRVYAPQILARLGTTAHFCEVVVPCLRIKEGADPAEFGAEFGDVVAHSRGTEQVHRLLRVLDHCRATERK